MEPEQAKAILKSLADGRDPATGNQFPPDSPYQKADTVRALYMALEALEKGTGPREPRPIDPNRPKAGKAWTPEEEQSVVEAFKKGVPFPEIAATHGRTRGAITARLIKLGLIKENYAQKTSVSQEEQPPPDQEPPPEGDEPFPF